jgi:hypothetical protein
MDTKTIVCPRCEGSIPNNVMPGAYPGAISRIDNKTEVCSECGMEEAIFALIHISMWPLTQWQEASEEDERIKLLKEYCQPAWVRLNERLEFDKIRNGEA